MPQETKIPIWLDCDPGHDDAFAILLTAHHPNILPLGISTVHGNSSLAHTTQNALSLLTALSSTQIPIYAGSSHGLTRPAIHAPAIHGASGLDGTFLLPTPTITARTDVTAIEAMSTALLSSPPKTTWLVATGALTNIAMAFEKYPELAEHVKGVSIMGGAIGNDFTDAKLGSVDGAPRVGNWSVHAEFNILIDPEAAAYIFSHPVLSKKTTLIPLDVTHLVLTTREIQELLLKGKNGNGETTLRRMLVELLGFFAHTYQDVFGLVEGPPLHDPLAVAVIFDGYEGVEIPFYDFAGEGGRRERYEVEIVTKGSHEDAAKGAETGKTVVRLLDEGEEGVKIPRGLDIRRFWEVLEDTLGRADEANRVNGVV